MSKYQTPDSRFFLGRSPISRISEESSNNLDLSSISSPNQKDSAKKHQNMDSLNNLSILSRNILLPDVLKLKNAAIMCTILQKTNNNLANHQKYFGFHVIKLDFEAAKQKNLSLLKLDYFYHKLKFGVYRKLAENANLKVKKLNFYSSSNKPENFCKILVRSLILYRDLTCDGGPLNLKPVSESQFLTLIKLQRFLIKTSYNYKIGRRKRLQDVFQKVYFAAIETLSEEEILGAKDFCRFSIVLQSNRSQICNRSKLMLTPERSRTSLNDSSVSVHILNNNVVKVGEISATDLSSFYNSSISMSPDERIRKFQKKLQNLNKILNKKLPSLKSKHLHKFIHYEQAFSQIFRVFNVFMNRIKIGFFQNFIFMSSFRTKRIEALKTMGLINEKYLSKKMSQTFHCWRGKIIDQMKKNQMDRVRNEKVARLENKRRALTKMERIIYKSSMRKLYGSLREKVKGYKRMKRMGDILRNQVKFQMIRALFYIKFFKCKNEFSPDQKLFYFIQVVNSIRKNKKVLAFFNISSYQKYSDSCLLRISRLGSDLKGAQLRNAGFVFRKLKEQSIVSNFNERIIEYENFNEKMEKSDALKSLIRTQNSFKKYLKSFSFKKIINTSYLVTTRMNSLSHLLTILENNRTRSVKATLSHLVFDSMEKLSFLMEENKEAHKRSCLKRIGCFLEKDLQQKLSKVLANFKNNSTRKQYLQSNSLQLTSKLRNFSFRRLKDSFCSLVGRSNEFMVRASGTKRMFAIFSSQINLRRTDLFYALRSSYQRNTFKYEKFSLQIARTFDRIYSKKISLAFGTLKSKWEAAIVEYLIMQELVNQKNEERNEYVELLIEKLKRRQKNKLKPPQTRKRTESIEKLCTPLTISTINGNEERTKAKGIYPSTLSSIDDATTNTQNDLEILENHKRSKNTKNTLNNTRISESLREDKNYLKLSEKDNISIIEKAERLLGRNLDFSMKSDMIEKQSEKSENANRLSSMLKPQYLDYLETGRLNENNKNSAQKVSTYLIESRSKIKENSSQEFLNDHDILETSNNNRLIVNSGYDKLKRAFRKENSKNTIILSPTEDKNLLRSNVFPIKENNKLLNGNIPPQSPNEMNYFQSERLRNYQSSSQVGNSTRRINISNQLFDEILDNRINNSSTHRNELRVRCNKNSEREDSCEMCGGKYRQDEDYMNNLYHQEKENNSTYNTGRKNKDVSLNYDVLPTKNLRAHFLN